LEKVFGKIASPTTLCIDERERKMRERAVISYFFQLYPKEKKNSFTHEAVLEISVW
jgi:hypothetical protein